MRTSNLLFAGGAALALAGTGMLSASAAHASSADVVDADVQDNPITVPVNVQDTLNDTHLLDGGVVSPTVPVGSVVGVDH